MLPAWSSWARVEVDHSVARVVRPNGRTRCAAHAWVGRTTTSSVSTLVTFSLKVTRTTASRLSLLTVEDASSHSAGGPPAVRSGARCSRPALRTTGEERRNQVGSPSFPIGPNVPVAESVVPASTVHRPCSAPGHEPHRIRPDVRRNGYLRGPVRLGVDPHDRAAGVLADVERSGDRLLGDEHRLRQRLVEPVITRIGVVDRQCVELVGLG